MPLPATTSTPAARSPGTDAAFDVAEMTVAMSRGEEAAFRTFHAHYFRRLAGYLMIASRGDEHRMKDALQETFRRVVKHVRPFTDETVFWSWLTVVARTALADERRRERRYWGFLDRFRVFSVAPEMRSCAVIVPTTIQTLLDQLPAEDRALIEAKYYEQQTVRDIAASLGTTESAIESRLVRIRRKLKPALIAALNHEAHD